MAVGPRGLPGLGGRGLQGLWEGPLCQTNAGSILTNGESGSQAEQVKGGGPACGHPPAKRLFLDMVLSHLTKGFEPHPWVLETP